MNHRNDHRGDAGHNPVSTPPSPAWSGLRQHVRFAGLALLVVLVITGGAATFGRLTTGSTIPTAPAADTRHMTHPGAVARAIGGDAPGSVEDAASVRRWIGARQAIASEPTSLSDAALSAIAQPMTPPPMTILLMGVDARPGESIDSGVRPDAIGVLRLDPDSRSCRLLTIPRDTRVELPGYGLSKINHALSVGGVPYQTQVVEQFLGLEIDRYALADFAGFSAVIDAIGGVTITVQEPFSIGEFSFEPGEQVLNGEQALAYVRYRGGTDGDFGRVARQQQMLRAIVAQGTRPEVLLSLGQILAAVDAHVRTDLPVLELTSLLAYYQTACGPSAIVMETLSGEISTYYDPLVGEDLSYVVVSEEEKAARVATLLGFDQ